MISRPSVTILGTFMKWYPLEWHGGRKGRYKKNAKCICSCGREFTAILTLIKNGNTSSCGCWQKSRVSQANTTHGARTAKRTDPHYWIWSSMIQRCCNPKNKSYARYGGRGIKVSEEFKTYEQFMEQMGTRPDDALTLERIDNNGDYSPMNCRWATRLEQGQNKRNTPFLTLQGSTRTVMIWAKITGINQGTIHSRRYAGWSDEKILTTPVRITRRA